MPLFKITTHVREIRKAVVANSYEDFINAACDKLGVSKNEGVKAVLDSDSTEIDEWEVLEAFKGETIRILNFNEKSNCNSFLTCPPEADNFGDIQNDVQDMNTERNVENSSIFGIVNVIPTSIFVDDTISVPASNSSLISQPCVEDVYPTLPVFYDYVENKLQEERPLPIFAMVVKELAYGLVAKYHMRTKKEYQIVGQLTYKKYPCIRIDKQAQIPWKLLTDKLSTKIRHIRWLEKTKDETGFVSAVEKKRRKTTNEGKPSCSVIVEATDASYEENVLLLKVEFNETDVDIPKILRLNRETFQRRRKWLTNSNFDHIIQEFPHLLDLRFLEAELNLMINSENSKVVFSDNYVKLYAIFEKELSTEMEEEEFVKNLELIHFLEKSLVQTGRVKGVTKAKSKQKKSAPFSIINVTKDHQPSPSLKDAPQLVVCEKDDEKEVYIVYKDVVILCPSSLVESVYYLIGFYFVFDLSYPGVLGQVLGFIQEHVLNDNTFFVKTLKYLKFVDMFSVEKHLNAK